MGIAMGNHGSPLSFLCWIGKMIRRKLAACGAESPVCGTKLNIWCINCRTGGEPGLWITLWSKNVGKLWENLARSFFVNILWLHAITYRYELEMRPIFSPHVVLQPCVKPNLVCNSQKTYRRPSIPMASLVHRMRTGHGAPNDPNDQIKL